MSAFGFIAFFFQEGGPFMFIILGVGVLAAAVGFERAVVILTAGRISVEKLLSKIVAALRQGELAKAQTVCKGGSVPLMRVGAAILDQPSDSTTERP